MQLYSYQQKCIEAIQNCKDDHQLISMPTGTGKTITFLSLAYHSNQNCLILVHRQELLEQTLTKALKIGFLEEEISCITSSSKECMKRLSIAMVPTLYRNLSIYDPNHIKMIIVDEAHHSLADSYMRVFKHFKIFEENKKLIGFTATPLRGDGKSLGLLYKNHSFKMTLEEATKLGYICPVHGLRINIRYGIESIESKGGDYDISVLDKIINCPTLNEIIAQKCSTLMRLPCIIFCTTVNHANNIKQLLIDKNLKAEVISYLNTKSECTEILRKLNNREIDYILNAVKLTEGFDHPPIQTIVIARPTRSPTLYKQMIGRGLRLSPNKFDCLVMEFGTNDPKMICWDDIDSNCTFHCYTEKEKISSQQALQTYKSKFCSKNIEILDVRVSPFSFYECKVQRIEKYGKLWRYLPTDDGFLLGKIFTCQIIQKRYPVYKIKMYLCLWKEKYKSFSLYTAGILWDEKEGQLDLNVCEKQFKFYADRALHGKDSRLSKWYPSEEEPMTPFQKAILPNLKTNARKAEMTIEDNFIKKAIDKFGEKGELEKYTEDEEGRCINNILYTI